MSKKKDVRSLKDYVKLYNMGFSAIGKLEGHARNSSDKKERKAYRKQADDILAFMYDLRDAQRVYLSKSASSDTPAKRLRSAVKTAEKKLDQLEKANKAIQAADKLLKLAKGLLVLIA